MYRREVLAAGGATVVATRFVFRSRVDDTNRGSDTDAYGPLDEAGVDGIKEVVVSPDGTTAYLAVTDGFAIVDLSDPTAPKLVHEQRDLVADHPDGPLRGIYDVALAGDDLVVASQGGENGELYAFVVYDVSDPANPQQRLTREVRGSIHNCEVADGHVYVTGLHAGHHSDTESSPAIPVEIYDIRSEEAPMVAEWSPLDKNETWADVPARNRIIHDVSVVSGRAYLAYWDAGAVLLDVTDPADPTFLSRVGEFTAEELTAMSDAELAAEATEGPAGNAHHVTGSADGSLFGVGKEAWDDPNTEGGGPGGIDLYDASDPTNPQQVATIAPESSPDETRGGVWTTAHNFEIRGNRLYSSWYRAGVKIYDISDPGSPELLTWWLRPRETNFWTAQAGAPGEFFIASSASGANAGPPDSRESLFVFPDRAGEQADRPSLASALDSASTTTRTRSPTTPPGATGTVGSPAETASTPELGTPGTNVEGTNTTTADETTTTGGQPGFGVLAALGGITAGLYRYLRRG